MKNFYMVVSMCALALSAWLALVEPDSEKYLLYTVVAIVFGNCYDIRRLQDKK